MLSILSNRNYRHLFGSQILSLLGSGLATVALVLLAYDLAGKNAGLVLGTAYAIKMVAYVCISPTVGVIVNRFSRRSFLVALDLCRAGFVGMLPFVTEIWQIYLLVFLFQSFSAAFTPTFQATIPDVLPDENDYTRALSLSRIAYDLESLLSPVLAAALITFISFHWLFLGTAIGFLTSALLVSTVKLPSNKILVPVDKIYNKITRGLRFYLATPRLRGLLSLSIVVATAGAMVLVNTVIVVREQFGASEHFVALFFAVYGSGSIIVALCLPRLVKIYTDRSVMFAGAAVVIVGLMFPSFFSTLPSSLLAWFVLGVGTSMILTPSGRLLVRSSNIDDRPAFFTAHFSLSHAGWLITYPLAGWAGITFGVANTFLIFAGLSLLGALMGAWLWRRESDTEIEHSHKAMDHEHPHFHDEHHQHNHEQWNDAEPHTHQHSHHSVRHRHTFIIDDHHPKWPTIL
jgi:MFS family permease